MALTIQSDEHCVPNYLVTVNYTKFETEVLFDTIGREVETSHLQKYNKAEKSEALNFKSAIQNCLFCKRNTAEPLLKWLINSQGTHRLNYILTMALYLWYNAIVPKIKYRDFLRIVPISYFFLPMKHEQIMNFSSELTISHSIISCKHYSFIFAFLYILYKYRHKTLTFPSTSL